MNAKQYLKKRLSEIRDKVANISFTYSHEEEIGYHIVYVQPPSVYGENEEYKALEMELVSDFDAKFPHEDILVTDQEEFYENSKVEFVLDTISPSKHKERITWNVEPAHVGGEITYALAA